MTIGIAPLVDYAFKILLGNQHHPNITIHFLNAVLAEEYTITSVEFISPSPLKRNPDDRLNVLHLVATDAHGQRLNITFQITLPAGMPQMLGYFAARGLVNQLSEPESVIPLELRPSVCICVLASHLFPEPQALKLHFELRHDSQSAPLSDLLQIYVLQLSHLQVTEETLSTATPLERWAWFLQHASELSPEQVARLLPDQPFTQAAEILEMITHNPQQLAEYNARLKAKHNETAHML